MVLVFYLRVIIGNLMREKSVPLPLFPLLYFMERGTKGGEVIRNISILMRKKRKKEKDQHLT
jgi:hypothetical protein